MVVLSEAWKDVWCAQFSPLSQSRPNYATGPIVRLKLGVEEIVVLNKASDAEELVSHLSRERSF